MPYFNISEIDITFFTPLHLELNNHQRKEKASCLPAAYPKLWNETFSTLCSLTQWWSGRNGENRCRQMCRRLESPTVRKERGDTVYCFLNQYIADFYGSAEVWNLSHFSISEIDINFFNSLLLELKNQKKKEKESSLPLTNP